MKELGFEGVDSRGTDLDNGIYGSVIYDVKKTKTRCQKKLKVRKESKQEKAKLDREGLRKELKSMDVLGRLAVEEEKQMSEDDRTAENNLKDLIEKEKTNDEER